MDNNGRCGESLPEYVVDGSGEDEGSEAVDEIKSGCVRAAKVRPAFVTFSMECLLLINHLVSYPGCCC